VWSGWKELAMVEKVEHGCCATANGDLGVPGAASLNGCCKVPGISQAAQEGHKCINSRDCRHDHAALVIAVH